MIAAATPTRRARSGCIRWIEVIEEPSLRFDPIASNRTIGHAERLRCFFFGHASKEAAFDDLSQTVIEGREALERPVECHERFGAFLDGYLHLIEIETLPFSTALARTDFARVLDENPPHRLRCDGKKMRTARESRARLVRELHVCFVHERRRAQRMAGTLEAKLSVCDAPQLIIEQREQRLGRPDARARFSVAGVVGGLGGIHGGDVGVREEDTPGPEVGNPFPVFPRIVADL